MPSWHWTMVLAWWYINRNTLFFNMTLSWLISSGINIMITNIVWRITIFETCCMALCGLVKSQYSPRNASELILVDARLYILKKLLFHCVSLRELIMWNYLHHYSASIPFPRISTTLILYKALVNWAKILDSPIKNFWISFKSCTKRQLPCLSPHGLHCRIGELR